MFAEPALEAPPLVHLFWTGGWDSTFRLLEAAISERRQVQPYYVIDPDRASHPAELRAMEQIRTKANAGAAEGRIAPLITLHRSDLRVTSDISQAYHRLKQIGPLGSQYAWLAAARRKLDLPAIELSIHQDDKAHRFLVKGLEGSPAVQTLFAGYEFPLREMTKSEMHRAAERAGFLPLLELSWFCHSGGTLPCGLCSPCGDAMRENMSYRMPRRAKLRYRLRHLIRFGRALRSRAFGAFGA